jgi:hypothetical protein
MASQPTHPMQPPPRPPTPPPAPPKQPSKAADPQEAKLEAHAAPPRWDEPKPVKDRPDFTPKAAIDPRAEKPPAGAYADGMTIADEQRARSAWIEAHGMKAYEEAIDTRSEEERGKRQTPGVTPPTKRE